MPRVADVPALTAETAGETAETVVEVAEAVEAVVIHATPSKVIPDTMVRPVLHSIGLFYRADDNY